MSESCHKLAVVVATLALLASCEGNEGKLGDLRIEICADLLTGTESVELVVGRPEGFASSLPPGASLENVDGQGPDELVWPVPEPDGGWSASVFVHIDNVIGNESVSARVRYGGSQVALSSPVALSAGLSLPVCLPTSDAGPGGGDGDGGAPEDAGIPEDDVPITSAGLGDSTQPSMASTGSELAIAWADGRDGNDEIYFVRLDASGAIIGSELRVTEDPAYSSAPKLVWTGSEYGLAWHDERDGNPEIYFVRISATGAVQGSPTRVTNADGSSIFPSLVYNDSGYGLAWEDNRDGFFQVYFTRLGPAGAEIGDDLRLTATSTSAAAPSLVWTGAEYALAWHDRRNSDEEIYFVRLDGEGNKLTTDQRITAASGLSLIPSLVWDGNGFAIAWEDGRDGLLSMFFVQLTLSGAKVGTEISLTAPDASARSADLLWTGSQYALAWSDTRSGNPEIFFAAIDSAGDLLGTPTALTNSGASALEPSLTRASSQTKAVWQDSRDGNFEIYFQAAAP